MQILIRLPEDLAARFKAAVPARSRSAYIAGLLDQKLPQEADALYRLALEVEQDEALCAAMDDWDATAADGLEEREGDATR